MRREVLYQYDLPIEILDALPADEEVLAVIFGRSKEKYKIPILISKKRLLWAYPEKETVYKVFEQHYIDIVTASAKIPPALSPTITIETTTRKIVFPNIIDTIEDIRAALLTLADQLKLRTDTHWEILLQQNLLTDEYLLQQNPNISLSECLDDDIFEEEIRDTTPHETLFSHFPSDEDLEFFEAKEENDSPESAVIERVARMVEATEPVAEPKPEPKNDAVIYETFSRSKDEQWHDEGGGDAEILPRGRPWKTHSNPSPAKVEHYSPEDDDSEVYVSEPPRPKLVVPKPKPVELPPKNTEPITLQPKEGIDEETIDKSLEALKFLKDNNIISDAEYKKRSLSLFEKEGVSPDESQ